jgi:hypothetical protein
VKEWTLSEIHGVWRELCVATDEIDQAVSEAVGQRGALWARRAVDADGKPWPAGERDASEPGRGTPSAGWRRACRCRGRPQWSGQHVRSGVPFKGYRLGWSWVCVIFCWSHQENHPR